MSQPRFKAKKGGMHVVHSLAILHVRDNSPPTPRKKRKLIHKHGLNPYNHFVIPFEEIKQMRSDYEAGMQPRQIAKKYRHGYTYVLKIVNGEARVWA